MNVNAKIDWHAGMELTAQTFIELDKCLERNRQITNTVAYGNHFGILPTSTFSCKGVFVKKHWRLLRFRLWRLCLLASCCI